jgi:hypothetical protein
MPAAPGGEAGAGGEREVVNDGIERRPQIVEHVADDRSEIWRRLLPDLDAVDVLRAPSVELATDWIGVAFAEPLQAVVECTQVVLRPLDLQASAL